MTRSHLRACPACARHVRVSEQACPFCKSALSPAFRADSAPQGPGARLSRAALFAFGTGTLAMAPGCSTSVTPLYGAAPIEADGGLQDVPAYGGAPGDGGPGPIVDAAYGGPPIFIDAEADAADAGGGDAAEDAPFVLDAAYGGPPIDSGSD
jgi:hypothetical protein